jgi:hypothetical protein
MARPVFKPSRGREARVILADVSRSLRDTLAFRDSLRSIYRDHDALILFDSSARVISTRASDSIRAALPTSRRGDIGAALIAAQRAASGLRERADSLELVIVSPFAAEELDASTDSIRKLWSGRARIIRIASRADSITTPALDVKALPADPIQITAGFARRIGRSNAILVRDGSSVEPSDGKVVIEWPASGRPRGAIPRQRPDTIGGVVAGYDLVVSPFERKWTYPPDSIRSATVAARWIDGEPAAVEWPSADGCVRSAAVSVASTGDLVLQDDFARFVAALSAECEASRALRPADAASIDRLEGAGGLASRDTFRPRGDVRSSIAPWLIAAAIVLAILELFVRRRWNEAAVVGRDESLERAA